MRLSYQADCDGLKARPARPSDPRPETERKRRSDKDKDKGHLGAAVLDHLGHLTIEANVARAMAEVQPEIDRAVDEAMRAAGPEIDRAVAEAMAELEDVLPMLRPLPHPDPQPNPRPRPRTAPRPFSR